MKQTGDLPRVSGHWPSSIARCLPCGALRASQRVLLTVVIAGPCIVATPGIGTAHASEAGAFNDAQGQTVALVARSDLPTGHGEVTGADQAMVLREAEAAYHNARYDAAMAGFALVAAMQDEPFAWLRIGNIWHRRGQSAMAMDAYTRAVLAARATDGTAGIAGRARKNLVLLGLSLAEQSAQQLDARTTTGQWAREIQRRLARLESNIAPPVAQRVDSPRSPSTPGRAAVTQGGSTVRATVSKPRISTVRLDAGS